MPPIAFLALLAITLLVLAAIRLELDYRRTDKGRAEPRPGAPRPELRAAPAGGYCQPPLSDGLFGKK
ncbi:MAG TPA: hypothetical protein VF782_00730 [Allosphingosinicella sp.]|jgi:hypothetical protein